MINHGISTGALFFPGRHDITSGRHSRLIEAYGGIARVVPPVRRDLTIVSLSSIALPGPTVRRRIPGADSDLPHLSDRDGVATTGVIVAAAYLLTALQAVIYISPEAPQNEKLTT